MFGFEKKSTRQTVPHDIDVAVKADDGLVVARPIGPWRDVEREIINSPIGLSFEQSSGADNSETKRHSVAKGCCSPARLVFY
jgi:hypothetical protein